MLIQFSPLHSSFWLVCQEATHGNYCKGKSTALLQYQFCLFIKFQMLIQIDGLLKYLKLIGYKLFRDSKI